MVVSLMSGVLVCVVGLLMRNCGSSVMLVLVVYV